MNKRILAITLAMAAVAASVLGSEFPADRWGRHPVKIYIERHSDVYKFQALGVSIEELRDGYVEAAVTPEKLKELKASGWHVEPRIEKPPDPDIVSAYHDYEWLTAKLDSVCSQYPEIARKCTLGISQQGRVQWALLITDHPDSAENEAEVRFTATIHGDEPVGTEMCIGMIDSLTQCYGSVSEISDLVNSREIWFVPMYNPDGNTLGQRNLANNVDPNRNFPVPDGSIGDDGTYTNYAETQNFIDFWSEKRAVLSATFHGGALIANYPWDYADSVGTAPTDPADLYLARQVSLGYSRLNQPMYYNPNPGSPYDSGVIYGYTWYPAPGSLQDWSYQETSCLDITLEIGSTKWPSASTLPTYWGDNRAGIAYYIRQAGWGVQGVVKGFDTGAPLNLVKIDVAGINKPVYTDSLAGDYHRMLMTCYYDLTFTKAGYRTKTFNNVRVRLDSVTNLDVMLFPEVLATLSGTVRDSSNGDPIQGAVVKLTGAGSDTTDSGGGYSIQPYMDYYTVTVTAIGYLPKTVDSVLVSGSTALDFELAPLNSFSYFSNDTISIPDNGAWIEDSLWADCNVTMADYECYINVAHTYRGDLAVRLLAPSGDSLRLHQRSGGAADNIVGWYDSELTPADSLRWNALVGQNAQGWWRLRAKDFASSYTGKLNGWGLRIFSTDTGVEGNPPGPARPPALFLANRPNPFGRGTVITYAVSGAGEQRVVLAIHNVAGQRVRTLVDGLQSPAKYLLEWDGRDDLGRRLPAGVYIARLAAGGRSASKKLVIVR